MSINEHIIFDAVMTVIITLIASSGFWTLIVKRFDERLADTKLEQLQMDLLRGLAHDRIIYLGLKYIERGQITHAEFENLSEYLFRPYKQMGGNGSADRIMEELRKIPIVSSQYDIVENPRELKEF